MSFTKYPKNWHSNGYGWHNAAALTYGKNSNDSDTSSGVSSLYPGAPAPPLGGSGTNIGK